MADRQRMKQVLLNLLSNAVKYNRHGGGVLVSVSRPGGWARIEVADTGPGIPREALDRVFRPFDRLGAEQTEVEGTGLGLALSRGLVEAMGGRIGVESRPARDAPSGSNLPRPSPRTTRSTRPGTSPSSPGAGRSCP